MNTKTITLMPIYRQTMQNCVSAISKAKEIVFIGYSLPDSDFYARFMFQCGFHNQKEGEILSSGRGNSLKNTKITVVNPSSDAARKVKQITKTEAEFEWFPGTANEWVSSQN